MSFKLPIKPFAAWVWVCFAGVISAAAQNASVGGKVTSAADGASPLAEVLISIKENGLNTKTDAAGLYSFTALKAGKYTLTFSKANYEEVVKTVTLTDSSNVKLEVELTPVATSTGEVVIVGYGVQNRRDVTGSISRVNGKDLADVPAPSFEAALQGKAAGVQVVVGSGMAGSASLVRVRGVASISASGDPLYVIDGIPVTQDYFLNRNNGSNFGGGFNNNPLASINPEDIESVDILKDAAATSIYGSRGANGVILITTKRARKKGLTFDVGLRYSIATPTRMPRMLTGPEWLQLYQEAWENDGNTGAPDLTRVGVNMSWAEAQQYNTNWVDNVIGTGFKQNYSVGANYLGKKVGIKFNLTYDDNGSYIIGNSYKRLSERVNFDWKPIKGMTVSLSQSLSNGQNRRVDAAWAGGLGAAMSTMLPIYPETPLKNSNGIGYRTPTPLNVIRDLKNWRSIELRSINNLNINYQLAKGLSVNASSSYDYMDYNEYIYEPSELIKYYNANYLQNGNAKWWPTWTRNYNYYVTLNYDKNIQRQHDINLMVGHEYQNSLTRSKYVENFDATGPLYNVEAPDTARLETRRTPYEWAFLSYFGRANYRFRNKLNVQLTGRVDGSSRFGRNNRYGFFPAISAGYILSDEEFIKRYKWISFLKVKAGVGRCGNASFDNYARWGTITPSSNLQNYNGNQQLAPARLENPNLRWETTRNFDASIEASFFKNRFGVEISYYNKNTQDVILEVTVPRAIGFNTYYDNVGGIMNRGVELTLRSQNIIGKKFRWSTDLNVARNYNEITSIGVYSEDAVSGGTNDTRVVVGSPVGTNFMVRFVRVDAATGKPVYLDRNGNETYTWDPVNRVAVGNVLPKAFGNLANNFSFGNFDVNINIYFNLGGNIYESSAKRQLGVVTDWNMDPRIFDRWQKPGDEAQYPRMTLNTFTYGSTTPWINTDLWLQDATYARLRTVMIGYRLPQEWVKKRKFNYARISFVGTNLFTVTKYTGLDPEIARDFESPTDRNMSGSIMYLTAPQEKSYSIAIHLGF